MPKRSTKPQPPPPEPTYRCQFCEAETPAAEWVKDRCPKCRAKYDPILAQEGDD